MSLNQNEVDVTLNGGYEEATDGTWNVVCVFGKISSQEKAAWVSAWLEHVVSMRLHEISEVVHIEGYRQKGLQ